MSKDRSLWVEVHETLWTHPKTLELARLLNIPTGMAAMHIARLWTWAAKVTETGDLSLMPYEEIAAGAGWFKDPRKFVEAAKACGDPVGKAGFLEIIDGKLFIHDWALYIEKLILARKKDNERKKNAKGNSNGKSGGNSDGIPEGESEENEAENPVEIPRLTVPNRNRTEKYYTHTYSARAQWTQEIREAAQRVIRKMWDYGREYSDRDINLAPVVHALEDGYSEFDLLDLVEIMGARWGGNSQTNTGECRDNFLTPYILFAPENIETFRMSTTREIIIPGYEGVGAGS